MMWGRMQMMSLILKMLSSGCLWNMYMEISIKS